MAEKRPRISWASETVNKAFLEACIYEMVHNGREGCGLKRTSWDAISEKLKNDHGYLADRKQVKNRYDYLKFKYQAWAILKNKTGNFYNPITNTFTMSNEEWEKEAKLNKFVDKLRYVPFSFPDLCIQLFDSATSTGSHSWGPSSTVNHPAEVFTEHDFEDIQCSQMETPTLEMEIPASTDPPPASEESSGRSKNKGGKRNGGKEARVNTLDDDLREVGREIVKAAQSFVEKNNIDKDMDECMAKLDSLEWGEFNPRYNTALMLFAESAGNMKVWLRLYYREFLGFLLLSWYWLMLVRRRQRQRRIERIGANDLVASGYEYTQRLIHRSPTECYDMMRLSQEAFVLLCNHFTQRNWLQGSRTICVEEKMAMFLHVIGHNERFRAVKGRFQHSTQTIHKCFHEVLVAMMCFAKEIIVPTSSDVIANTSERHRRLKDVFPGAIGALDGTLVHAVLPFDEQTRYRGRGKGECYQNVLGICNFDMIFTFVWAGWEGIAHDSRVLKEVAFNPTSGFPFPPPDKYYLCDAAYTNTCGFMAPYRNTRYWLADFRRRRALTEEERFNHAHAQLRNVIERAYGVLKARFPILKQMTPYPFPIQRDIVIACFAVHNFIRKYNIQDDLFTNFEENTTVASDVQGGGSEDQNTQGIEWGSEAVQYMVNLRDQIANQLLLSGSS